MNNRKINILGWIVFTVSSIGFILSSADNFWSMFGSIFFFLGCLIFLIPFFRKDK